MKNISDSLMSLYARLLLLYPRSFQMEFTKEMEMVFRDLLNEAMEDGILPFIIACAKELGGLPINILREFWYEFDGKEKVMVEDQANNAEAVTGEIKNRLDVILGTLPFALFGIAMMLGKASLPIHGAYPELGFFIVVLIGLVIGLAKGFPRWAYSYLGWSMVMSWTWMMMSMDTFQNYRNPLMHNQLLGWWGWTPFILSLGIGLLLARSFRPIRQMLLGIWHDWTLASFMIYTFVAFVLLIYDENHHPYLFLFMTASTIILSASVWFFMQSVDTRTRAISLLSGFVLAFVALYICDTTWDQHIYYGYPKPAEYVYETVLRFAVFLVFYGLILFIPGLVGLIKNTFNKEPTS